MFQTYTGRYAAFWINPWSEPEVLWKHEVLEVLVTLLVPAPLWIRVNLAVSPAWHPLPRDPDIIVVLHSDSCLSINIRNSHLALLIEFPIEGLSALGKSLVVACAKEILISRNHPLLHFPNIQHHPHLLLDLKSQNYLM